MVTVYKGSSFAPSPHRDPQKDYVVEEETFIPMATESDDAYSVLKRADDLGNRNGRVSLMELDRFDNPTANAFLSPKERAALARAHARFEVPPATEHDSTPLSLKYERAVPPPLIINDLSVAEKAAATRFQWVHNEDGNMGTISHADLLQLDAVIASGALTPTEIASLQGLRSKLEPTVRLVVGGVHSLQNRHPTAAPPRNWFRTEETIKQGEVELVQTVMWVLMRDAKGRPQLRAAETIVRLEAPKLKHVFVEAEGLGDVLTRDGHQGIRKKELIIRHEGAKTYLVRWLDQQGSLQMERIKVRAPTVASAGSVPSGAKLKEIADVDGRNVVYSQAPLVTP